MTSEIAYLRGEFQQSLKDPAFLEQFARLSIARSEHPELLVADFWEQVGACMKYGLINEASWHPQGSWPARLPRMDQLKLDADAKSVSQ